MKLLILSWHEYPHVGGKSTHITNLINAFKSLNIDVTILTLKSIDGIMFNFIRLIMFPVKIIKKTLYTLLWCKVVTFLFEMKILKAIKKERFDIINSQDAMSAMAAEKAKSLFKLPVITTMHTYLGIENSLDKQRKQFNTKIYERLLNLERRSLVVSDAFIAVDTRIKEHLMEEMAKINICASNVYIIYNFTNTDKFYPVNDITKQKLRRKYNLSETDFIIICARRLVEKNGVIYAVKAIKKLRKYKNIKLFILGDGIQKNFITEYIKKNNLKKNITLFGAINNDKIREFYQMANLSLVPSITVNGLQEATSISAIEAMSCGLPVIASNIGGLKEIIKNGETGFLVEEKDESAIAVVVEKLYNDMHLCKKIGRGARQSILNGYSHIAAAKKHLEVYQLVSRRANV